jgi:hypothetical protein
MFGDLLDRAPETWVYHEWHPSAFRQWRLRDSGRINKLIQSSNAACIVFKPIVQSYDADRIIDTFDGSRGIWIYRSFRDVANSSVQKWSGQHRQYIERLVSGNTVELEECSERSPEFVEELRQSVSYPNLNDHEGAALYWYVQNQFYFSLGLHNDRRILLVNYENLVTRPHDVGAAVFEHIGLEFNASYAEEIHAASVNRYGSPELRDDIRRICDKLLDRLHACTFESRSADGK